MNVNCSTCLELLTPSDDLSSVPCGHVFHTPCILQWLETGKNNCPQCRTRCQEKQLRRVYFTEGVGKFIKNSVPANFSGGLIINLFESKNFRIFHSVRCQHLAKSFGFYYVSTSMLRIREEIIQRKCGRIDGQKCWSERRIQKFGEKV